MKPKTFFSPSISTFHKDLGCKFEAVKICFAFFRPTNSSTTVDNQHATQHKSFVFN